MRVLYLQQQPCIRTLKYAAGLRAARGGDLTLGFAARGKTLSDFYGYGDELFDRWWSLGAEPAADLARVVDEFAPDLVHSHNLPDQLTVLAQELLGGDVPVIHDVHDFQSLRSTPYEDGFPEPAGPLGLERRAVEDSDALLTVSDELLGEIAARYTPPRRSYVFGNYVLESLLPAELPDPRRNGGGPPRIVYQGTLSANHGHYDLRAIFCSLVAGGATVDVYPSREVPEYAALADAIPGLTVHATLDPRALLPELTRYDFGWAGFNTSLNAAHLHTVLPNKAFEYLGCGLPILTLDHRALARFVAEEGVGIALPTVEGVAERLRDVDLPALRGHVLAARDRFTVEGRIAGVVELYEQLVHRRS